MLNIQAMEKETFKPTLSFWSIVFLPVNVSPLYHQQSLSEAPEKNKWHLA